MFFKLNVLICQDNKNKKTKIYCQAPFIQPQHETATKKKKTIRTQIRVKTHRKERE